MSWNRFTLSHHLPFVRGIHWPMVYSPQRGSVMQNFYVSFIITQNKLLTKQSICWRFGALWQLRNVSVMMMSLPSWSREIWVNILRPRQNGRRFAEDTFKRIFLDENVMIFIKISLKFVPNVRINNIPALVQIMAWRLPGDKPLSEPTMVRLLMHICVTRPQWVKHWGLKMAEILKATFWT